MKTIVCDIDNTICRTIKGDYVNSQPIKNRIGKINNLFDEGNYIIYFTSRGKITKKNWRKLTKKQFKEWGVKYNELIFGKPFGDLYIDDRAKNARDFF